MALRAFEEILDSALLKVLACAMEPLAEPEGTRDVFECSAPTISGCGFCH